jgi:hypothetical protein
MQRHCECLLWGSKTSALFAEFRETGINKKLGFRTPDDLRAAYPGFFWQTVKPYIEDALRYLRGTQEGKLWIANLYAHVFSEEHRGAIGNRTVTPLRRKNERNRFSRINSPSVSAAWTKPLRAFALPRIEQPRR